MIFLRLRRAVFTDSVEVSDISVDPPVKMRVRERIDMLDGIHIKIHNTAAAFAQKMIVRGSNRVEMIAAVHAGELVYFPVLRKKIQVAVYGSEADVRKAFTHFGIDDIGGGMLLRGP